MNQNRGPQTPIPSDFQLEQHRRQVIFTPGIGVGAASGSIGGVTLSHNRGGPYMRRRAIPITSTTPKALAAKNRLAAGSAAWQSLTDGQRLSWKEWAQENPIVNALGTPITLTGHQAYVGNFTRMQTAVQTPLTAPPIAPAPIPLATIAGTFDIGIGNFDVIYTPTPTAADEVLWLVGNVHNSPGINYVENTKRFIGVSGTAEASPYDYQAQIEAVFGTLVVDQHIALFAHVFSTTTGLLSTPQRVDGIIVST